jgi:pyrimidine-nucleoside phosphorylase
MRRGGSLRQPPTMRAVDLIRKKRDAAEHTREEIEFLIHGASRGTIPDYQLTAWLMAVVWRGMSRAELAALTDAMLHSGVVLDFSDFPAPKVDKHSTGGVGDKTSLIIAPIVAAGGLYVPMISGRGLGHTGGTLDKLESIPGFNVHLSLEKFRRVLAECGCALIGQTPEIAPADRKLYALRDVPATVESPYLNCASIMSKKLAEGIDGLVLDVKTGSGAFMKRKEDAYHLAELLVEAAVRMGKKAVALLTDMDQPLGRQVGNALEVGECIEVLHGEGPEDLRALCFELAARMFLLGGRVATAGEGRRLAGELVASGKAARKFQEIIRLQGGDERLVDEPEHLPHAQFTAEIVSPHAGYVVRISSEDLGRASVMLGGGRERAEDRVDPAAGLTLDAKLGDHVEKGTRVATLHYNAHSRLPAAKALAEESYVIRPEPIVRAPLVHGLIGAESR